MDTLGEIAHLVRACTDCELHQGRTNSVPGEGAADAELMFIGEGPGYQEDRRGVPSWDRRGSSSRNCWGPSG